MREQADRLREMIRRRELIIGGHTFLTDPAITEALGCIGYDVIWIDAEHFAFDLQKILCHIMAAASAGKASLVRVPTNDPVLLKPILEMGPDAIVVPMVSSAQEARRAVSACTYPPEGVRGFGPKRAFGYGMTELSEYLKQAKQSVFLMAQIEHVDAVRNLDEIMEVPGIDLLMVGPNDLSASVGCLGDTRHPKVMSLLDEIGEKCGRAGTPFGVSLGPFDRESVTDWIRRGVSMISCGDDISFLKMGGEATIGMIRSIAAS